MKGDRYQSIDWGGNSFAGEVLTVSTQPERKPILSELFLFQEYKKNAPSLLDRERLTGDWEFSLSF